MKVDVKYGKDGVQETEIPDSAYIGTFYPKDVECGDPDQVIGDSIDLKRSETDKGPIVLQGVKSREITLTSSEGEHGVTVDMGNMTTFVAWTVLNMKAQFLCLEPMVSFGFASRPLEIEKMEETRLLKEGESEVWENTFIVF